MPQKATFSFLEGISKKILIFLLFKNLPLEFHLPEVDAQQKQILIDELPPHILDITPPKIFPVFFL